LWSLFKFGYFYKRTWPEYPEFFLNFIVVKEIVEDFDSSSKEDVYRALENAVIKQQFNLNLILGEKGYLFAGVSIYPATFDAISVDSQGIQIGTCTVKLKYDTNIRFKKIN
jgi:hypothetical protein